MFVTDRLGRNANTGPSPLTTIPLANEVTGAVDDYEGDVRVITDRGTSGDLTASAGPQIPAALTEPKRIRTVTIRPDGNVESIELDRSSGLKVLDAAAFKIVRMASPFAVFPPDIRRDTDLLVITRTWFFGQGDKIWTE